MNGVKRKNKVGRPSIYSPDFCGKVIALGRLGKSRCQIAAALGVCWRTLQNFEREHPEFIAATIRARELAQAWWEDQGQKGIWVEHFNANAYRLQITNRFPDQWRDKQTLEHAGKDGGTIKVEMMSPEERRADMMRRGELDARGRLIQQKNS